MNLNTFLLIDGSLMLIGLPLLMIFKGKKTKDKENKNLLFRYLIFILINY